MLRESRSAAVLAVCFALACADRKAEVAGPKGPAHVVIGATLPLTGAEAKAGAKFRRGYELAVEEANQRGGLELRAGKAKVDLLVRDDETKADVVTAQATKLLEVDKVDYLLGSYTSSLVGAGSDVAEKAHVPFVNGAGGLLDLYHRQYRYLFGLQPPVEQLSTSLMTWIRTAQKSGRLPRPARVAVLWENTGYGKSFRRGLMEFRDRSENANDWNVVFDESFDLGTKNFGPTLARLKAAHADVFLASPHLAEYVELHKQYVAAGLCHKIESYGSRGQEKDLAKAFGDHGTDGLLTASFWNARVGNKALVKTFVDGFRAKHGEEPDWYEALGYETARVLLVAIERAGVNDREAVREKLASTQFPSIMPGGQLNFPAESGQQARFLYVVLQNQASGPAIVFPNIAATSDGEVPTPRCRPLSKQASR